MVSLECFIDLGSTQPL